MNWIERLNRSPSCIRLGSLGKAHVSSWAYSPALPDNVPHRHAYHEVCLVGDRGLGEYRVQAERHLLVPGTVFFARPGIMHQIISQKANPLELYWVSFQIEPDTAPSANGDALTGFTQSSIWARPDTDGALGSLWQSLRTLAANPSTPLTDARRNALMSALLLGLLEAGSAVLQTLPALDFARDGQAVPARAALRHIHDHLSGTLTVRELATVAGVSPRHLARLMVQLTGLAPAAYIETARLDRARFLLLRTDDPIKQIAVQVGYRDVYHFTRAFSRRFGCPPGAFRATGGTASRRLLAASVENIGALV